MKSKTPVLLRDKLSGLTVAEREVVLAIFQNTGQIPTAMIRTFRKSRRFNPRPQFLKKAA